MPIYEDSNTSREKLFELRKRNRCSQCGGILNVFLDMESHLAYLACNSDQSHEGIVREASPLFEPNIPTRREMMQEELGQEKATKLMKYEGVVSLTRVQAMEILMTIWPDAPDTEVLKAAMVCQLYGLNPLMKHVFLIPFKRRKEGKVVGVDWVVVLGISTNRLIAQRKHHYSYLDMTPRRMTDAEQEKVLGEVDVSRIWAITKIKDMATGAEVMGVGSWPRDEVPYGAEKGNTKLNMACVRSERQALDRQYPAEMPQGVEVIDEKYIGGEAVISLPEGGDKTGEPEVVLGEEMGTAVLSPTGQEAQKIGSAPPTQSEAKTKSPEDITEDDIPDLNALTKVVFHFYKLQPPQVWKELGYKSQWDVNETAWECWLKIKGLQSTNSNED